jgi:CRISPR/Cas system-associated exonuclease Cas4 (RecB family)
MLKELIDKFYTENQKNKEQTRFYITDAGKCPRAVFFKLKNVQREGINARILRIFEHGEHIHRNIFNILYRLRVGVTTEIPIPAQEIVSGRADAILCIDKENYVLDIKSINSMIFRTLLEPKQDNVFQIQLYMHYFNIKKGILLYIDKDQQEMKEFTLDYNQEIVEGLLSGFSNLKIKVEKDIMPERLTDYPKNWQCQYCQFKQTCKLLNGNECNWQEEKTKIQIT